MAFVGWQGAEECAVRLWVCSLRPLPQFRSPGINGDYRLRRNLAVERYRGVPTPVLLLTLLLLGGMFWQRGRHLDDAFMPSAAIWKHTALRD